MAGILVLLNMENQQTHSGPRLIIIIIFFFCGNFTTHWEIEMSNYSQFHRKLEPKTLIYRKEGVIV